MALYPAPKKKKNNVNSFNFSHDFRCWVNPRRKIMVKIL
jgi:hypothetical protein